MGYTDSLGFEPEAGAIFVATKENGEISVMRRFGGDDDDKRNYPVNVKTPSMSDASGKLITTGRYEIYLIKYNGKKWRRIK